MGGKCVEKLPHNTDKCRSKDGVQVFEDDGKYTGFCFSCGTFIPDPYGDHPEGYKPNIRVKTDAEIEAEIAEVRDDYGCHDLPERQLKKQYLDYFGVKVGVNEADGVTPSSVFFPFTKAGELIGYKARTLNPKKFWAIGTTKASDVFGWEQAKLTGGKKLFITEGEFDAVALFQIMKEHNKGTPYADLNPAVVSLSNGAGGAVKQLTTILPEIRKHFKEIVLVFDSDEPGKRASGDVQRIIPDALVAELPAKDANECIKNGRSKAAYNACQFQASRPKNTRLVHGNTLHEKAKEPPKYGLSWPWKHITQATRGIRFGETIYIGAG